MRIIFWEEMQDKEFWNILSPEEEIALKTIWEGVYDKLYSLDRELEIEETENEWAAVIIYLNKKAIQPKNYSSLLSGKINNCLDENAVKFILHRVQHALSRFLN